MQLQAQRIALHTWLIPASRSGMRHHVPSITLSCRLATQRTPPSPAVRVVSTFNSPRLRSHLFAPLSTLIDSETRSNKHSFSFDLLSRSRRLYTHQMILYSFTCDTAQYTDHIGVDLRISRFLATLFSYIPSFLILYVRRRRQPVPQRTSRRFPLSYTSFGRSVTFEDPCKDPV